MYKKVFTSILSVFLFLQIYSQPTNTNISNGILFDGEPYIAINPTNSQNLVAAWMSLKFSGGGYHIAIKYRASFNGGNTWSAAGTLPHFASTYTSADVSMAFDKNGMLYLSFIDSRQSPDSGGIFITRSLNGGLNWDTPTKAFDVYDDASKFPVDRPWLVVDKSNTANSGTLYITSKPAPWIAPPNRNYFKVSSDSGHAWSPIANVDGGTHLVGSAIAAPMAAPSVTTNGKFSAIYPSYVSSQNILPAYYLASSSDKGQTFSYTTVIAAVPAANDTNLKNGYQFITHPADSNKMIFFIPDATNGDDDIMALHSNDGGQTWSSRIRVNDDSIGNGKDQDMVWGAYNEQGNIAVSWRDRRNSTVNGFWNSGYDFYYALSNDNGQTFSANQKLSSQFIAFDSVIDQNGNDFMSLAYHSDTLYTVWGDTRNDRMNIYFSKTIASSNTNVNTILLEGEEPQWKLFPNPAKTEINVAIPAELLKKEISIYDVNGRKLSSEIIASQNTNIKIQDLAKGIYFLRIGDYAKQFIKE